MNKIIRSYFAYVPLIIVELYLAITLLLFKFGPLDWKIQNETMFWGLILLYHLSFICGYLIVMKKITIHKNTYSLDALDAKQFNKVVWVFIGICIIACCVEYRNLTFASSYIPYELPMNFINGLINPAEQYYNKFATPSDFTGNKVVTMLSACISFIYVSLIPFLVIKWKQITKIQKAFLFGVIFLRIAVYVSIGTNKGIFDIMFSFAGILLLLLLLNIYCGDESHIDRRTFVKVIILVFALVVFSFGYFTLNISSRVESPIQSAINSTVVEDENATDSTHSDDVDENEDVVENEEKKEIKDTFINRLYYSASDYLTQGYYGMSIALDEDFTTTYGIGNSEFLKSNFKSIFGIDVQERTYQHKITKQWDEYGRWHSFYSYVANDVSFWGVPIIMFIIGALYAAMCKDIIYNDTLLAKLFVVLLIILFIYIPANNQIFTSMWTCTAFIEFSLLWIVSKILTVKKKNEQ